jgi:hypothetical protein
MREGDSFSKEKCGWEKGLQVDWQRRSRLEERKEREEEIWWAVAAQSSGSFHRRLRCTARYVYTAYQGLFGPIYNHIQFYS